MKSVARFLGTLGRRMFPAIGPSRRQFLKTVVAAAAFTVAGLGPAAFADDRHGDDHGGGNRDQHWVGTWTTSPQGSQGGTYPTGFAVGQPPLGFAFPNDEASNQTLRIIVRVSIGGDTLRIRLSNTFGSKPVRFGRAFIGLQATGGNVVSGSNRQLTFGGKHSVTVPVGREVYSDPVALEVMENSALAVSLFVQGSSGPMTWHAAAFTTSYITDPDAGDHTADLEDSAFPNSTTSWFFVDAVEVRAGRKSFAIVAFGDSITDGFFSTLNEADRWPDVLARRLHARHRTREVSVVNEAIGGNMITRLQRVQDGCTPCDGPPALDRLDRDVFGVPGVKVVILLEGINDLGGADATAEQVIAGMREIVRRVHRKGLKIIGATLTPSTGTAFVLYGTPETNAKRLEVNRFIRESGEFDAVVDIDAATRDPHNPDFLLPAFNTNSTLGGPGDFLHPNRAGFIAMANAFDLSFFDMLVDDDD